MDIAGAGGTTLYITESYRSEEQQDAYYAQGRTTPGPIVTNCQGANCPHVQRRALDVYPVRNGRPLLNATRSEMQVVGQIGEAAGFEWGGRWRRPDQPHWEVPEP
jgi:peptidoglycan L-alanyl-D-glutamate endopeptidase CwlK